ncbi:MAG TPA: LLM class flavin-dependent oxidoreductase [Myxococcota bacterium]|nr:LLM class flavin-dependent oxidoreductase [Myxococcota bacterium]
MKIGLLQFFSWPNRRVPLPAIYERALARVEVMERSGYDAIWLAEHHFTSYSVCPSVHVMATHIAARTRRLRIGTAVTLAAFYHPLRIAEEVALLDVLSGGRVNWGAGRGFDANEFASFGVAPEESAERFREAVEVVLAAWQSERLDFSGKFHRFANVEVLPKPLQQPHPPTWVAATSDSAIAWAAQRGHSILMDPHSTHAEIARKRESYRAQLEQHGHSFAGRTLPMARLIAIAPTDAQAEQVARRGASWTTASYVKAKSLSTFRGDGAELDPAEHYLKDVILHGSPAKIVDHIQRLQSEMYLDYLMLAPLSEKTFELFTNEVLPKLA